MTIEAMVPASLKQGKKAEMRCRGATRGSIYEESGLRSEEAGALRQQRAQDC
jgi:hypothetical protein